MPSCSHRWRCCMVKEYVENCCDRCGLPPPINESKVNVDKLSPSTAGGLAPKKAPKRTKPRKLMNGCKKSYDRKCHSFSRSSAYPAHRMLIIRRSNLSRKLTGRLTADVIATPSNGAKRDTEQSLKKRSSRKSHSRHSSKHRHRSSRSGII